MSTLPTSTYAEGSIRVLKGLEPVKQRPGMYTRTDNPVHLSGQVDVFGAEASRSGIAACDGLGDVTS